MAAERRLRSRSPPCSLGHPKRRLMAVLLLAMLGVVFAETSASTSKTARTPSPPSSETTPIPTLATEMAAPTPMPTMILTPVPTVYSPYTPLPTIASTPAVTAAGAVMEPGLVVQSKDFLTGNVTVLAIDTEVNFWGRPVPRLAARWVGKIRIKHAGNYTFEFEGEGGGKVEIGSKSTQVVGLGSNGTDGVQINTGSIYLQSGFHPIDVYYQEVLGQAGVILKYSGPDSDGELQAVPPSAFFHVRGPCDLRAVPHISKNPCPGRWALASGEQCVASCEVGYFVIQRPGVPFGGGASIACLNGQLSPKEICAALECAPPSVANVLGARCLEGPAIPDGARCTPVCPEGQVPSMEGPLTCRNGSLTGSWTDCHAPQPCAIDAAAIPNAALEPCASGHVIQHGQKCLAQCEDGYVATVDPVCKDGLFPTETALSPPFACKMTTTSTTKPPTTTTPTTTEEPTTTETRRRWTTTSTSTTPANVVREVIDDAESLVMGDDRGPPWFLLLFLTVLICCGYACFVLVSRMSDGRQSKRSGSSAPYRERSNSQVDLLNSEDSDGEALPNDMQEIVAAASTQGQERIISASWRPGSATAPQPARSSHQPHGSASGGVPWSDVSLGSRGGIHYPGTGHAAWSDVRSGSGHAGWSDVRPLE